MANAFIMRNIDWIDGSKLTLPGGGAEKAPPRLWDKNFGISNITL